MHNSSRLALPIPDSSDDVSAYPAVSAARTAILDSLAGYESSTLAARPAADDYPAGTFHYATDTETLVIGNGGSWLTVFGGSWQPLTLGTGFAGVGELTPSARLLGTDTVQLKGTIRNTSGASQTPSVSSPVFTLPGSLSPQSSYIVPLLLPWNSYSGGTFQTLYMELVENASDTAHVLIVSQNTEAFGSNDTIALDGVTFTLS